MELNALTGTSTTRRRATGIRRSLGPIMVTRTTGTSCRIATPEAEKIEAQRPEAQTLDAHTLDSEDGQSNEKQSPSWAVAEPEA